MKKLFIASLLLTGLIVSKVMAMGEFAESNLVQTGLNRATLTSSGTVGNLTLAGFGKQQTIYRVQCSSGVDGLNEFIQMFELTVATPAGGLSYNTFFPTATVFPAYVLKSTGTFGGIGGTNLNIVDFFPFGVLTSTPYFYYGGGTAVGERPCTIFFK